MSQTAHGTFEVTLTPQPPDDSGMGRFDLVKTWSGDLTGASRGLMLSAGDPARAEAGYVALEVVEGTLGGRSGSFAFQQLGVMRPGGQELRYDVVPGSGSGELAGLEGSLALTIDGEGVHTYDLEYTVAPDAS
jgi:hypothetical protein